MKIIKIIEYHFLRIFFPKIFNEKYWNIDEYVKISFYADGISDYAIFNDDNTKC